MPLAIGKETYHLGFLLDNFCLKITENPNSTGLNNKEFIIISPSKKSKTGAISGLGLHCINT